MHLLPHNGMLGVGTFLVSSRSRILHNIQTVTNKVCKLLSDYAS